MNAQSSGRPGETRGWQAVLQRSIDTAAELSGLVAQRLGAAADPRARLLRKRRWALRLGWLFAGASAFWIAAHLRALRRMRFGVRNRCSS